MQKQAWKVVVTLGVVLLAICVLADVASACPTCKDGLSANDPHHANVVRGYFYSILLMMGMPFALIGCFSIYMYREVLKARAERQHAVATKAGEYRGDEA